MSVIKRSVKQTHCPVVLSCTQQTDLYLKLITSIAAKRFNSSKFELPTRLSAYLEKKIKEKKAFLPEDYSELCRTVRPFIELQTEDPLPDDLMFVAHKL